MNRYGRQGCRRPGFRCIAPSCFGPKRCWLPPVFRVWAITTTQGVHYTYRRWRVAPSPFTITVAVAIRQYRRHCRRHSHPCHHPLRRDRYPHCHRYDWSPPFPVAVAVAITDAATIMPRYRAAAAEPLLISKQPWRTSMIHLFFFTGLAGRLGGVFFTKCVRCARPMHACAQVCRRRVHAHHGR